MADLIFVSFDTITEDGAEAIVDIRLDTIEAIYSEKNKGVIVTDSGQKYAVHESRKQVFEKLQEAFRQKSKEKK